jgi:tetratricopeptide (TPR) repeat protein
MSTLAPGALLCGRFELVERLGAGGHGEVWRAHDRERDLDVALKVLHPSVARSPEAWDALRREYAIAQRLSHPRIVEVGEPLRDEQATVLPMTLATGDLRRLRGEPYVRILPALLEVASALQHAHERGVVHRDLKPSNVLIDEEGHIVVSDFGVAALESAPEASGGSPFSMSPQQIAGEPPRPADDIYGLGSLAYELLSGYPPHYPEADPRAVLERPIPPLLPIHPVPPRLTALVMQMLAKDPAQRPASMAEVGAGLELALRDTLDERPAAMTAAAANAANTAPALAAPLAEGIALDRDTDLASAPAAVGTGTPSVGNAEASGVTLPAPPSAAPVSSDASLAPTSRSADDAGLGAAIEARLERELELPAVSATAPRARRRVGLWLGLGALAVAVVGVFVWLPRFAPQPAAPAPRAAGSTTTTPAGSAADASAVATDAQQRAARLKEIEAIQQRFATRLADLEQRGAGIWGGPLFAAAKALAADADAARRAGNLELAQDRAATAERRLERVAAEAKVVLDAQLAEGERALQAGQSAAALQAFELALRIEPGNARATTGRERAGGLDNVLPVLAEAENAATRRDYAAAISLYEDVLRRDRANQAAQSGLARVRAAAGNDAYARAIGDALAALRAGQLDVARAALARARALRPQAPEVVAVAAQLGSAEAGRDLTGVKARAEAHEAAERWAEALAEYERLLKGDASLEFARVGRDRVAPRAQLAAALQGLIDQPARLAAPEVRAEADRLLARARAIDPAGPVLRSQVARIELLLPEYDRPVALTVLSDGQTSVRILRVGEFGAFERREIELKPGRYTLVGTRSGYRDVRRDITLLPAGATPPVDLRCSEPIE